ERALRRFMRVPIAFQYCETTGVLRVVLGAPGRERECVLDRLEADRQPACIDGGDADQEVSVGMARRAPQDLFACPTYAFGVAAVQAVLGRALEVREVFRRLDGGSRGVSLRGCSGI